MRKFTDEFKREVMRLVKASGRTLGQVADDLGAGQSIPGQWLTRHRGADLLSTPPSTTFLTLPGRPLGPDHEWLSAVGCLCLFDLAGGVYNGVQAVRGGEGMMSGSVVYVVELYDSTSNSLLDAAVTKQYPGAYNIGATFGRLGAAETGLDKGAQALVKRLR